jgi:hypothetical protein
MKRKKQAAKDAERATAEASKDAKAASSSSPSSSAWASGGGGAYGGVAEDVEHDEIAPPNQHVNVWVWSFVSGDMRVRGFVSGDMRGGFGRSKHPHNRNGRKGGPTGF